MELLCKYCGEKFKTSHRTATYCSRACRNKAVCSNKKLSEEHKSNIRKSTKGQINVGSNNPQYGKKGELSPTYGTQRTEEVKKYLSDIKKGKYKLELNPNWRGGKSFEPYSLEWTNELKTTIRKRDSFTCFICGANGFDVHHIDYDKNNCNTSNLITLCRSCHAKTHHQRESWIQFFNETLIEV